MNASSSGGKLREASINEQPPAEKGGRLFEKIEKNQADEA